jgi:hypothetical protein
MTTSPNFKKKPMAEAMDNLAKEDELRQDWSDIEDIETAVGDLLVSTHFSFQNILNYVITNSDLVDDISKVELLVVSFDKDFEFFTSRINEIKATHADKSGEILDDDLYIGIRAHEDLVDLSTKTSAILIPLMMELTAVARDVESKLNPVVNVTPEEVISNA